MSLNPDPANDEDRLFYSFPSSKDSVFAGFDGNFSIPDPGEAGPWVLKADHRDYAVAFLEVEPGQTGIELVLEQGWEVTGTVDWGEDLDMERYWVELKRDPDLGFSMDSNGTDFVDKGKPWSLQRIGSGNYTLRIGLGYGGNVLHRQELQLEGEGGRLDLGSIDLHGKLAQTTFTLASGIGKEDGGFAVVDRDGSILGADFGRTLLVAYPEDTHELALWVQGYRTILIDELKREAEITLEPGIPVAVEIDAVRELPEGVFITTLLVRVEDPEDGPGLPGYLAQRTYRSPGLEHHVSEPGRFRLHAILGLVEEGLPAGFSTTMSHLVSGTQGPIIEVKEGSELQVIHASIEDQLVMDALAELRELEGKNRN
ncbi:MAG: hypothetical protein ACPG31_00950 [Planctomycetota bacterium]